MTDLDTLLTDHLHRRGKEAVPVYEIHRVIVGEPLDTAGARRPPRRWIATGAAAALVVAATVGAVVLEQGHDTPAPADPTGPLVGDHWHTAYGFDLCGDWKTLTGNQEETVVTNGEQTYANGQYAATGVHSHDDGLIHLHPFTAAGEGENATLGLFLDVYGVELTDDTLHFPPDQGGDRYDERTTTCDGETGQLSVTVWPDAHSPDQSTTYVDNLADIRLTDHGAITIAFTADDQSIQQPPSVEDMDLHAAADGSSPWQDGATLRIYLRPGANPADVAAVRDALAGHGDIVDLDRLTYLDEAATLEIASAEFASDPATLEILQANGTPSRFNVHSAPGSSDKAVVQLVNELDMADLEGVMSIATPAESAEP